MMLLHLASLFPAAEPIPLPAPVWLFKALLDLTTTLHFIPMQLFMGGLILGIILNWRGSAARNKGLVEASKAVVVALPVVMTYVINLGVPPLLFTQVLYGRALYTSSVVMGAVWISVILLIMISYHSLYIAGKQAHSGKPWYRMGLLSLLFAVLISKIYTMNMTLMLRPEAWPEMYRANPLGAIFPTGDPTMTPRWLYMMSAGLMTGGIGMVLLSFRKTLSEDARQRLWGIGACVAAVFALVSLGAGVWAFSRQPEMVREAVMGHPLYLVSALGWAGLSVLLVTGGILACLLKWKPMGVALALVGALQIACMVLVRDGVRDESLMMHGLDVWSREVVTNWGVVGAFFLVFALGLAAMGWLISVAWSAKEPEPARS